MRCSQRRLQLKYARSPSCNATMSVTLSLTAACVTPCPPPHATDNMGDDSTSDPRDSRDGDHSASDPSKPSKAGNPDHVSTTPGNVSSSHIGTQHAADAMSARLRKRKSEVPAADADDLYLSPQQVHQHAVLPNVF